MMSNIVTFDDPRMNLMRRRVSILGMKRHSESAETAETAESADLMAIRVASGPSAASVALVAAVLATRLAVDTRTAIHLALRACRLTVATCVHATAFGLRRRRPRTRVTEGGAHGQMAFIERRRTAALRCSQRCRTPSWSRRIAQCGLASSMPCGTAAHDARHTEQVIGLQRRAATPGVAMPRRQWHQTISCGLSWPDASTGGAKAACPATEQIGSFRSFRSFCSFGRTSSRFWASDPKVPKCHKFESSSR